MANDTDAGVVRFVTDKILECLGDLTDDYAVAASIARSVQITVLANLAQQGADGFLLATTIMRREADLYAQWAAARTVSELDAAVRASCTYVIDATFADTPARRAD